MAAGQVGLVHTVRQALHKRLQKSSSKVKSLAATPGVALTALMGNLAQQYMNQGMMNEEKVAGLFKGMQKRYRAPQSPADGAVCLMEAAFGADANSGDVFMPKDQVSHHRIIAPPLTSRRHPPPK